MSENGLENLVGFAVVQERDELRLPIPGMEEHAELHITIRNAIADDIGKAGAPMMKVAATAASKRRDPSESQVAAATNEQWIQQCLTQVVDFCLPSIKTPRTPWDGETVVRYDSVNSGDNFRNRQVFSKLTPNMVNWLTGAFNFINGDAEADEGDLFRVWWTRYQRSSSATSEPAAGSPEQ